jgi:histidinol phosphatase-like PHP family hydrolase
VDDLDDFNMAAAGLLQDMAALHSEKGGQLGYKRAAAAIIGLPEPIAGVVRAGTLLDVPGVGQASARIVQEFLEHGRSPTVDAAVEASGKSAAIESERRLRRGFLSHYALTKALEAASHPGAVELREYRGDFQMHSSYSDGAERLGTMVAACLSLGHTCLGITDHSYGLSVARGMSMATAARQWQDVDRLNAKHAGAIRVFKGIEANIQADGFLDLQPSEREAFEYVVAAPHSLLRKEEDQTARMLTAVRSAGVAILGHPRGRVYGRRAGVRADWDRVFAAAAERQVAIEIDGNWHRQDIDYDLARRALDAGCLFALDSDAHSIAELRFSEYSVAHARLAGIPSSRVINCWSVERLEAWMAAR